MTDARWEAAATEYVDANRHWNRAGWIATIATALQSAYDAGRSAAEPEIAMLRQQRDNNAKEWYQKGHAAGVREETTDIWKARAGGGGPNVLHDMWRGEKEPCPCCAELAALRARETPMTPHDALRRLVDVAVRATTISAWWAVPNRLRAELKDAAVAAQAALGAGRECANPEQHRCADYHRQEDEIASLRARLRAVEAEREAKHRIIKGVHGALMDAATVPVPDLTADLYESVMLIVRQRDALAAALARYGRHETNCDFLPACICGLDAAREG